MAASETSMIEIFAETVSNILAKIFHLLMFDRVQNTRLNSPSPLPSPLKIFFFSERKTNSIIENISQILLCGNMLLHTFSSLCIFQRQMNILFKRPTPGKYVIMIQYYHDSDVTKSVDVYIRSRTVSQRGRALLYSCR